MHSRISSFMLIKRWSLLVSIFILLGLFFYFKLYDLLSFESIKAHRMALLALKDEYFFGSILLYLLTYILVVAASVPGAAVLTILGGFLFGTILGSLLVIIGATLGAMLVNLAVEFAFREWFIKVSSEGIKRMEAGLKKNAVSYLLFLRLVPIFPFWLVNIVPALLGISRRIFFITTLIGIIPGTVVYVLVGNGLGRIFDQHQTPNLGMIFEPRLLIPLCALGVLSLLPIFYNLYKTKNRA